MENKAIHYENNIKHSYMYIEDAVYDEGNYETKMLLNTKIPGAIPLSLREQNGTQWIQYDISSVESMEKHFEMRKMGCQDVASLINSIDALLSRMEEFLLPETLIYLDPAAIFFDQEHECYLFTLLPEYKENFSISLSILLDWVLKKIDYDSDRTVIMAYTLFQESCKQFFKMDDLVRIVRHNLEKARREKVLTQMQDQKNPRQENERLLSDNPPSEGDRNITAWNSAILSSDGVFRFLPDSPGAGNGSSMGQNTFRPKLPFMKPFQNFSGNTVGNGHDVYQADNISNSDSARMAQGNYSDGNVPEIYPSDYENENIGSEAWETEGSGNRGKKKLFGLIPFGGRNPNDAGDKDMEENDEPSHSAEWEGEADIYPYGENVALESNADSRAPLLAAAIQAERLGKMYRLRLSCSFILLIALPFGIWFAKGAGTFRRLLPGIVLLECGIAILMVLDFMMAKLPADKA